MSTTFLQNLATFLFADILTDLAMHNKFAVHNNLFSTSRQI